MGDQVKVDLQVSGKFASISLVFITMRWALTDGVLHSRYKGKKYLMREPNLSVQHAG